MAITQYNDPILPIWYTDGVGNKISIEIINEYYKVVNNKIWLNGIPDSFAKINTIKIDSVILYEVKNKGQVNINNFTVDYNLGIITLHSSYDGKTALIQNWKSRGAIFFPASRVYDTIEGNITNGEFIGMTLQDYIQEIKKYLYKGEYSSTIIYFKNNIVYYNGSTYLVINDNNGMGVKNIDPYDSNYWRLLTTGFQYRGEYNNSTTYYPRDLVTFNNSTFICILKSTGNNPTNIIYWNVITSGLNYRLDYNSTTQYYKNDLVQFGGDTYICLQNTLNNPPSNPIYWHLFAKRGDNFFYYDSTIEIQHNLNTYNVNVLVVSEGTYGHGGYGNFAMENKYQLETIVEYINVNTVRLHWSDYFIGVPTLTQIVAGSEYTISFSGEDTVLYVYIK